MDSVSPSDLFFQPSPDQFTTQKPSSSQFAKSSTEEQSSKPEYEKVRRSFLPRSFQLSQKPQTQPTTNNDVSPKIGIIMPSQSAAPRKQLFFRPPVRKIKQLQVQPDLVEIEDYEEDDDVDDLLSQRSAVFPGHRTEAFESRPHPYSSSLTSRSRIPQSHQPRSSSHEKYARATAQRKTFSNFARSLPEDDHGVVGSDPDVLSQMEDEEDVDFHPPLGLCIPRMTPEGDSNGTMMLKPLSEIPAEYQSVFTFPYFNVVQSKVFDDTFYSDSSVVVCAPTGSGKTVVFELAIIRLLIQCKDMTSAHYKIVYMAPMKALCSERYEDWKRKFSPLGVRCMELTGDTEIDDFYELHESHLIFTTPEKWDSVTRRWRDNKSLVQQTRLFLIDEVHLLADDSRGATIEAVISRMKTVQAALSRDPSAAVPSWGIRFITVSATIPNAEDIAAWLGTSTSSAVCHKMDESCRPVRLRKVVIGYPYHDNMNEFKFDFSLNYRLPKLIETYSEGKPTLVFCSTRKAVQQAATMLAKEAQYNMNAEQRRRLIFIGNSLRDSKLRDMFISGVAFHHAGMDHSDRKSVETTYAQGDIRVLFSTSTLAMGVNLPAHLVIIKSTQQYVMGMYTEYNENQILQMIGRAGRPQFDDTATAVIMTKQRSKEKYENLLNGTQLIESSLHRHLIEHLNAEIVLGTITDVSVAIEWLRSTFLYIRIMKNPKHYGVQTDLTKVQVEQKLQEMCVKDLGLLSSIDLIQMDEDCFELKALDTGRLMARYCIAFETMKNLHEITGTETLEEMLCLFCKSHEFKDIPLRSNEKKILNTLNKDANKMTIRFPMKGKIKTAEMKVNCLLQTQFGCLTLQEFALQQDTNKINRAALRVARCLIEVLWQKKCGFQALCNAVILSKCIKAKLWENSRHLSKQLSGIGPAHANALVNAGLSSFQKIEDTNPRDIELIVNRHPPFGNQISAAVQALPKYELSIEQSNNYAENKAELTVILALTNADQVSTVDKRHAMALLIGDADNEVVCKVRISDTQLKKSGNWMKRIDVRRGVRGEELSVMLISQDWVGLDVQSTYTPFFVGPKKVTVSRKPTPAQSAGKKKPCGHRCADKSTCGHECCKSGSRVKQTAFQKFLQDTKQRATVPTLPTFPTPRLKRQAAQPLEQTKQPCLDQYQYKPKRSCRTSESGWEDLDAGTSSKQSRLPAAGSHATVEIDNFSDDLGFDENWLPEIDDPVDQKKKFTFRSNISALPPMSTFPPAKKAEKPLPWQCAQNSNERRTESTIVDKYNFDDISDTDLEIAMIDEENASHDDIYTGSFSPITQAEHPVSPAWEMGDGEFETRDAAPIISFQKPPLLPLSNTAASECRKPEEAAYSSFCSFSPPVIEDDEDSDPTFSSLFDGIF